MHTRTRNWPAAHLGNCPDLVLVDEEVGLAFARQPQHTIVKVLDPAAHGLSIAKLDGNINLAVAQGAEIKCFLTGFAGRGRLGSASG